MQRSDLTLLESHGTQPTQLHGLSALHHWATALLSSCGAGSEKCCESLIPFAVLVSLRNALISCNLWRAKDVGHEKVQCHRKRTLKRRVHGDHRPRFPSQSRFAAHLLKREERSWRWGALQTTDDGHATDPSMTRSFGAHERRRSHLLARRSSRLCCEATSDVVMDHKMNSTRFSGEQAELSR